MERAPWEIYIIEGVNNVEGVPPGSFAVLIRFHHAYVDGKAGLELTTALWEDTPEHEYGRRDHVEVAERAPTRLEMWARTAPRMIGQSFRSMRAGVEITRKSYELAKRLRGEAKPEQRRVPKTIFNTTISPHRSYAGYELTIAELKRMRQLCAGSSLNDVIITLIAGGMRRYLAAHNALPGNESLVSMCPVSIRPEDARKVGGNLVSAMFIGIGTDIADPVERLKAVQRRTQNGIPLAKEVLCDLNNAYGDMVPAYMRNMGAALGNKLRLAGKYPLINTVITNVPGIPGMQPKYFAGATIRAVSPIVPVADGVAISHGITGIYDRICIGILADHKVVGDMDFYVSCLADSTRELLAATEALEAAKAAAAKEVAATAEPVAKRKSASTDNTKVTRKAANSTDKQAASKAATSSADDAVVAAQQGKPGSAA